MGAVTGPADTVIAMDVGGTAIKAALLTRDGSVTRSTTVATGAAPVDTMTTVATSLAEQAERSTGARPLAAGVAVPGVVDEDAGIAVSSANLGWRDLPLRELLTERLRLPVVIGHDVRAGALAEARLGAGRGCPVFSFIAVGTGIAAAVVIDGTVLRGAHGAAGELGHLIVRPDGLECVCGQRGCVETVASASAIARRYEQSGGDPVSAERIAARAADSEPLAAEVWTEAVAALADGLVANQALFDPEVVAIGGGLARAGERLFGPLRGAVRVRLTFHAMPQIVPAQLGYLAGCQGAGLLAFDALPSS